MNYVETLKHLIDNQIVAILRVSSADIAIKATRALYNAGIKSIEVTMNVPDILSILEQLNQEYSEKDLLIGAGTVLDEVSCRMAILSGAEFIVTPTTNEAVIKCANRYQKPMICGALTPTEIVTAMELGVNLIKLYPASISTYGYLKAVKDPLPQAMIAPTGGVNLDNIVQWKENGASAFGIAGEFSKLANAEKYDELEKVARQYVNLLSDSEKNVQVNNEK